MKFIKQIAASVLVVVFLFSYAGILIYQIDCSCTGKQEVSLYVSPETCKDEFHIHHTPDSQGNELETGLHDCHDCTNHIDDCGCASPEVKYVRLINQITEEETEFLKTEIAALVPATVSLVEDNLKKIETKSNNFYIDPPPRFATSSEFLIQINKLKIPEIA